MDQEKQKRLCANKEFWDLLDNYLAEEKVLAQTALPDLVSQAQGNRASELTGAIRILDHIRALPLRLRDQAEQAQLEAQMESQAREEAKRTDDGF